MTIKSGIDCNSHLDLMLKCRNIGKKTANQFDQYEECVFINCTLVDRTIWYLYRWFIVLMEKNTNYVICPTEEMVLCIFTKIWIQSLFFEFPMWNEQKCNNFKKNPIFWMDSNFRMWRPTCNHQKYPTLVNCQSITYAQQKRTENIPATWCHWLKNVNIDGVRVKESARHSNTVLFGPIRMSHL